MFLIVSVDCQMQGMMGMLNTIPTMINGMRENQAKAQLTPIVKFVVGQTATPSPEMVNFAVIAGSAPSTQGEKNVYLDMMKQVARRTPEVLLQFIKKDKNGVPQLDEQKMDSHIMKRAMQFDSASRAKRERKLKKEQQRRQEELAAIKMQQQHELEIAGVLGPLPRSAFHDPLFGDPLMDPMLDPFTYSVDPLPVANSAPAPVSVNPAVNSQPAPAQNPPTQSPATTGAATDGHSTGNGFISLADILKTSQQNPTGSQRGTAGSQSNQLVPAPHVDVLPTANPMIDFMMMDSFMI